MVRTRSQLEHLSKDELIDELISIEPNDSIWRLYKKIWDSILWATCFKKIAIDC